MGNDTRKSTPGGERIAPRVHTEPPQFVVSMHSTGVDTPSTLSRRRAELWASGCWTAPEIPGADSRAEALASLFQFAGIPERGTDALKLLHEILVDQVDMLLQFQEQEVALTSAARVLNQYLDMYDFAPMAYLSVDLAGRIITANDSAATLFETTAGELVGGSIRQLFDAASGDALWNWAMSLSPDSGAKSLELECWRNSRHLCRLHAQARRIQSSNTLMLVLIDLTHILRDTQLPARSA